MNIRIQVMANQARQVIQQVRGDLTGLAAAGAAGATGATRAMGGVSAMGAALVKSGSQMQWAGRQLTYAFTLPLALAGAAATNFALKNEAAMVRMQKVYGDASMSSQQMRNETEALGKTFEVLSEKYGIARDQTIGIAADWAAAGSSGLALAKQTELTMQTMVLGELDATTATQALIAIQAQYNQSSSELSDTIARLNNVENQTGTTMAGLIDAMARSAGVARAAGVDVAHLAAMTAALTPAAGSAAQAGNALKTIISRLLSPTKDSMDVLGAMGIHITDLSWKSSDAATRIEMLSKHFEALSDAQKQVVSATLASRYQINKFDVLMDAINNKTSYYWKALDAASNRTQYLAQVQKELNMVLDSSPKKFDRIKVMLQNSLADAIQPLLPMMISLAGAVANLAKRFNELSPGTQKLIVEILLFLAVLGPIISKLGALKVLIGFLIRGFAFLVTPIAAVIGALWGVIAALTSMVWTAFIGTMGVIGSGIGVLGAAFMWLVSPVKFAALFMLEMFGGVWAAIRTSWIIGLTSLSSLAFAGLSLMGTGMQVLLGTQVGILSGIWAILGFNLRMAMLLWGGPLSAAMAGIMGLLGRVMALAGPALAAIWTAIGVTLSVITAEVGAGLARAWQFVMVMIEGVLVAGARALGIVWRASLIAMQVITAELGAGIAGIWRALQALLVTIQVAGGAALRGAAAVGMALFEGVLLAGAAIAGGIWRALQAAMVAIQVVGGRMLALVTTLTGRGLLGLWALISSGIGTIFMRGMTGMVAIARGGGTALMAMFTKLGPMLMKALTNPYVLAAVAVVVALYMMRDKLKGIWDNIVQFFNNIVGAIVQSFHNLPKGIQSSIMAVVNMVKAAAQAVYHWFSYLNPFAHHSPSLVENVTNGMAEVNRQFSTLTNIKGPIDAAYASIRAFKSASADLANGYDSIKTANEVADLSKAGASGAVISSYVNLAGQLSRLKTIQDQYSNAINRQQSVVDSWQKRLDSANKSLDAQKARLDDLQKTASAYRDQISAMQDDLSNFASAPLVGMRAMDDAIFGNQQEQKKLQLQMALMAQQGGQSYQDLASTIASVNGQIETLTSTNMDLRAGGAGSEITGVYDAQIAALQEQKKGLGTQANEVTKMQDALAKLQQQADILDLQKSLQFDGLTRSIDQAANGMNELPFDTVMAGVLRDKAAIADLTTHYDQATAAVDAQQKAVDAAQATVDSIQASYDAQKDVLDGLKDSYDQVTQAIQDMNQAMSDATSAASGLKAAQDAQLSPTMQAFNAGAGGDFPDVSGSGMLGREGDLGDQSAQIDAMTADLQKQLGDAFGGFDIFGPFKDMWNKFVGWWNGTAWPWIKAIFAPFKDIFSGVDLGGAFGKLFDGVDFSGIFTKVWTLISSIVDTVFDFGKLLWDLLGPDIQSIIGSFGEFFGRMGETIGRAFGDIKERIGPFLDALNNIWDIAKPFVEFFIGVFVVGIKMAFDLLKNIVGPVLNWIADMFGHMWDVVKGILDVFIGIFTGDWSRFWNGIKSIFDGIFGGIVDTVKAILGVFYGVVLTALGWIGDIFKWLWNSVISPVLNKIGAGFMWLYDHSIKYVVDLIVIIFKVWAAIFLWIWVDIIWFYLQKMGEGFHWLWENAIQPVLEWVFDKLAWVGDKFVWLWDHSIGWLISKISDGMNWVWNSVIQPVLKWIWDALGWVGDKFTWLWDHSIGWLIDKVKEGWNWLFYQVIAPVAQWISRKLTDLGDSFSSAGDGISRVWHTLGDGIQWVWDHSIGWVFGKIKEFLDQMPGWWSNAVDAIGRAWDGIMDKAKTPIQWVIDIVWNNGLRKLWNRLNDIWGGSDIDPFEFRAARGGVTPYGKGRNSGVMSGYSPGQDIHKFYSPTGGILNLSGGEAVMVPAFTQAMGGKSGIDYLNHVARTQGASGLQNILGGNTGDPQYLARGGMIELPGWLGTILNFVPGGGMVKDVVNSINSSGEGKGTLWEGMFQTPVKIAGGIWDKIKSWWDGGGDAASKSSGSAPGGTIGSGGSGATQIDRMFSFIRQTFPKANLNSAYRPGDPGYHGRGKAIDLGEAGFTGGAGRPYLASMNQWLYDHVGHIAELIYDGVGDTRPDIKNGANHTYDAATSAQHHNHVHWAMDQFDTGGLLRSGGLGINLSGRAERVLSPDQTGNFERLVNILDRVDFARLEARLNGSVAASAPVVYNNTGDTVTININGNLEFPGINDGRDADRFLRNLADMAGGSKR